MPVNPKCERGYQKGEFYDNCRPTYSDETIDAILQYTRKIEIDGTKESLIKYDILEMGAGTGKFTCKLVPKLQENEKFIACDQSEGFLKTMTKKMPDVKTMQCPASNIPLPDNSVKAIICPQSLHWFYDLESVNEMRRVLVPNGLFSVWIFNIDENVPWTYVYRDLMYEHELPFFTKAWKETLDQLADLELIKEDVIKGAKFGGPVEILLDMACSVCLYAIKSKEEKDKLRKGWREELVKHIPDPDYVDIPCYDHLYIYKNNA